MEIPVKISASGTAGPRTSRVSRPEARKPYPMGVLAGGAALPMMLLLLPAVTLILRGLHVAVRRNGPADGRFGGLAVICVGKLPPIRLEPLLVFYLRVHARSSWLVPCRRIGCLRPDLYAALPATEAGASVVVIFAIVESLIV
jgi:hypothetical protein